MSKLRAKALQYLELQDRLNALKCEIIGLTGVDHTSLHYDLRVETKRVDIIDDQKLKRDYPEAHQNCLAGTGTVLKVKRGGYHG
jgi:hypothetical protein